MEAGGRHRVESQVGVSADAMGGFDRNAPGQAGRLAVKFLVDEVGRAGQSLAEQSHRRDRIQEEPGVQFLLAQIEKERDRAKEQTAIKVQAAFPDGNHFGRVLEVIGIAAQGGIDHVPDARPENAHR